MNEKPLQTLVQYTKTLGSALECVDSQHQIILLVLNVNDFYDVRFWADCKIINIYLVSS